MAIRLGNDSVNSPRKAQTDALADSFDLGSTNPSARLLIYTGTQPATPQTAATGTLLVTINFASTAFTAADSNAAVALSGGAVSAVISANGPAGWFRVTDKSNRAVMDGSVGESSADMLFDDVDFVAGGTCSISAFNLSTPM